MKKINLFEFTAENGKKQLKQGLVLLIIEALIGFVWVLFTFIPNESAQLAFTIIFSLALFVVGIFMLVKLIFGIVVYRTEG